MSQQYLIKSLSDDWSFYIKTGFMDILRPNSVPSSELDGLSDHAVQISNGIISFFFVIPGILCTFEVFYGTEQEERAILQEIQENVEQAGLKKVEIIEKKYRIYKPLTQETTGNLLYLLKKRFEANMERHPWASSTSEWDCIQAKIEADRKKAWSLNEMERTGGEPDVAARHFQTGEYTFIDFSAESPAGRSNVVFDREAETWLAENSPEEKCRGNAVDMAEAMGIELLDADQYQEFQKLGRFDQATSTWLKTTESMRADGYGLDGSRYGLNLDISETRATCHHDAIRFRGRLVV